MATQMTDGGCGGGEMARRAVMECAGDQLGGSEFDEIGQEI